MKKKYKNKCKLVDGKFTCTSEYCKFFKSEGIVLFAGNFCQHSKYQEAGMYNPPKPYLCTCKEAQEEILNKED